MGDANGRPMLLIEAALRGGTVALLLLLALRLLLDARRAPAALYAGLFALSVAAYVVEAAPSLLYLHALWLVPLRIASIGAAAVFWLFASASFDDEFEPSWRDALPWLATVGLGCLCVFDQRPLACLAFQGLQLLFVALAIRQAVIGRAADLVEGRRRFRVVLVIAAALYTAVVVVLQLLMHGPPAGAPLSTANAMGLLALSFAFAAMQLSPSSRWQYKPAARPVQPTSPLYASRLRDVVSTIDEQEAALLDKLRRLMEDDKAYREEGLSIAALSGKLGIPEYRLRRLINQRLGHRNFSTFVNGYRLAEAMAALGDPGQGEVPIVTVALDAGFQSLGPFNRAFKAHTGMTPSDFRRLKLGQAETAQ